MDSLIIEFWRQGKKEAEMPMDELADLTREQEADFWYIQSILDREVMLRYEEGNGN